MEGRRSVTDTGHGGTPDTKGLRTWRDTEGPRTHGHTDFETWTLHMDKRNVDAKGHKGRQDMEGHGTWRDTGQ